MAILEVIVRGFFVMIIMSGVLAIIYNTMYGLLGINKPSVNS